MVTSKRWNSVMMSYGHHLMTNFVVDIKQYKLPFWKQQNGIINIISSFICVTGTKARLKSITYIYKASIIKHKITNRP